MPASSLGARLQRKVGPLPVWAWAAVILGAFLLYTRLSKSSSAASTDSTGVTSNDGTTDSGAQQPASGQGSSADNLSGDLLGNLDANTAAIDSLTSQLLSMPTPYSNVGDGPLAGAPASDGSQATDNRVSPSGYSTGPASQPTATQPATTAQLGGNVHETQTAAGVLHWDGVSFTDKASFDRWAKAHGTTTAKELSSHPQARSIYSTLR